MLNLGSINYSIKKIKKYNKYINVLILIYFYKFNNKTTLLFPDYYILNVLIKNRYYSWINSKKGLSIYVTQIYSNAKLLVYFFLSILLYILIFRIYYQSDIE